MMRKWKRPAAFLLAAAMIFTMPGIPVFAMETDTSAVHTGLCEHHPEHTEDCEYTEGTEGAACGYTCELCNSQDSGLIPGVSGNAPAECICETRCEQEAVNPDCPVCSAEDADLSACKGTEQAMSLMAGADDSVAEVTIGGTAKQYADIVAAFDAAQLETSATVKLLTNVTIPKNADGYSYGIELTGGNITLDLNGCTIQTTGGASDFVQRDAVFYIDDGSSLTVQDKSTNGGGKIVQPNGGQAIHVGYNGTLTVESGAIEVTSSDESRPGYVISDKNCAVFLTGGGTANILGGTLTGKQGIYVKSGTLSVSGGTIHGKNSYALQVAQDAVAHYNSRVTLTGGSYTTDVTDGCSIWNAAIAIRMKAARSPHAAAKTTTAWWAIPPSRSAPQTSSPTWARTARCRQRQTARC